MNSKKIFSSIGYVLLVFAALLLLQPSGGKWAWLIHMRWFYVLVLAGILSFVLTPVSILIARKFNILDNPDFNRKIHTVPVPRIGGLAIFAAVLLAVFRNYIFSPQITSLLLGSSIVFIVSFIDDIHPISATLRIVVQIAASLLVTSSGVTIQFFPVTWPFKEILDTVLTVFWLVGIANAVNLLDGADGLAASLVAVSSFFFFVIASPLYQKNLCFLSIALTGACLGFLPYNWKPAKTFMGDSGATFLGFFIAGLAVMGSWANNNPVVALSTPLLVLGIPIFDMIYTTVSRIKNGQVGNIKQWLEFTGKDHFHHRLMHLKFTEVQTVFFIIMLNICFGLSALAVQSTGLKASIFMLAQAVMIFLIIVFLMLKGRNIQKG